MAEKVFWNVLKVLTMRKLAKFFTIFSEGLFYLYLVEKTSIFSSCGGQRFI